MQRMIRIGILCVVTSVIIGCTTVRVSQDYDPQVELSGYNSWQWRDSEQPPTGDTRIDNPLLDRRIRRAVENHLAEKNFTVAEKMPELSLAYHLAIERKIYSDTYYSSMGMGGYYRPWYWDAGTETRVYQHDQSRLTIDIHSTNTGKLLWRGEGVYLLVTYKTPQEAAEAMQKTVDRIIEQFPPN